MSRIESAGMLSALRIRPWYRARAGPHAGRHAERGRQAGRVPVVERGLEPPDEVVGVEAAREHLDEQRIAADHRRRGRQRHPAAPASARGRCAPARSPRRTPPDTTAFGWPRSRSCRAAPTTRSTRTVSAASAANSSRVTPPQARPGAPNTVTAAASAAPTSTTATSTQVFGTEIRASGGQERDQQEACSKD